MKRRRLPPILVLVLELALLQTAGGYVLDELGLAARLFAVDAASLFAALLLLAVILGRLLLTCVLPACAALFVLAWIWPRRTPSAADQSDSVLASASSSPWNTR